MKRTALVLAALLCLCLPGAARAEAAELDSGGGAGYVGGEKGWLLNGETLGNGQTAFHGEIGWPGLQLSLLHGVSDQLDLGGLFAFNFGVEGITDYGAQPGLRLGGILRLNLMDNGKVNLGLRVAPAMILYFYSSGYYLGGSSTVFGFAIPIQVVVGIPISPQFAVHFDMGLPMTIALTPDSSFTLSILPGAGLEYKLDRALSLTFDTAFGAAINFGGGASFQLRALFGVGYRF